MNAKLTELARRRERLIDQSARQREQLGRAYRQLRGSFQWINLAAGAIQAVKAHPAAVTGLTALLIGTRWTRFQGLGRWLWLAWAIFKPVQGWRSRRRVGFLVPRQRCRTVARVRQDELDSPQR